jgi:beta-galactosidase
MPEAQDIRVKLQHRHQTYKTGGKVKELGQRSLHSLNDSWLFQKGDSLGADAPRFDDSTWESVTLPHTWNAHDGQDGPTTPYYRGIGWYRRHFTPAANLAGKRLYLQFDGASLISDVYVNGAHLGSHAGGFARFRFEVTNKLRFDGDNLIAVRVRNEAAVDSGYALIANSPTRHVAPLSADFTFFGGLYRGVFLLATHPLAIDPLDHASSGVYIEQSAVSSRSADLRITVKLSNGTPKSATPRIRTTISDATGARVHTFETTRVVPAHGTADASLSDTLLAPRLWNGRTDPYLYTVRVEVIDGEQIVDTVTEPLGLRSFTLDPSTGFSLNGRYLDLHGVNKHQDRKDKGWAIVVADTEQDFQIISEIGATMVRLAHYQHAEHTYELADRMGFVVWAETPVINHVNAAPEFAANAEAQLRELMRQNYNHPSIVFWSVGNEVLLRQGPDPTALIAHLSQRAALEDPTRLVAYAANAGNEDHPVNFHGVAHGFNEYPGWYGGKVSDFAAWVDAFHASHPEAAIGITEYGAGASIDQHATHPEASDLGTDHSHGFHSEEYQAYYHEGYWTAMQTRPFLWCKLVWAAFDFASDSRAEGTTPGLNDKGLITFDRRTKKDAFYWYKAQWSNEPFVHITSRRFASLAAAHGSIRVYSNQATVELRLNGVSLGTKATDNRIFVWDDVPWRSGQNVVLARAGSASDEVIWIK